MKLKTREAVMGVIIYRAAKFAAKRTLRKGGVVAAGKKVGMFAALGAALGALLFWRKKKKSGTDMGASD